MVRGADAESVVRRSIEAWNRGDWAALEALWDPDGEILAPPGWPESGAFRGWPAIRRQFERLKESWGDEHIELASMTTVRGTALAHVRWRGHGGASGLELDLEVWMLNTVRDGKLVRVEYHLSEDAARASVGEGAST
jgi:ketosteroid isomerase-like protein